LITAAVALLTPSMSLAGTATAAEFVSGTVKSIPVNTSGSLDAGGTTDLRFRYGKSVFSLPYKNITTAEVTEPIGKHLWKVPVPKVGKSARFLNISYREGTETRMLTFRAPTSAVNDVVASINAHRKGTESTTATTSAPPPPPAHAKAKAPAKAPAHAKAKAPAKAPAPVTAAPAATASAPSIKTDTEDWWGDRYWRTTRNKGKWPEVPAENAPGVPAGTKE
jgi:hypothetical protein